MKLLYITNQICGSGGLERVLSIKASYLADQLDYKVHIITLNQGDSPLFYEFSDNLIYHDVNVTNKNPFSYIKRLKRKVKEISPNIISVCDDGIKGFFLPLILNKPCPMIYERHASKNIFKTNENPNFICKLKFSIFNILMNYGASTYDSFVVLTKDNLKEWKLNNLKVIPNPLSFYPEEKAYLTNKKVITVGNHGFQKGYDRLLKSWKLVLDKHPDWILEIYGKIDKYQKHIKLSKELKIDNNITFFNPVKNIHDKYKEASIYAMSSRSEGFGMVLIEAMAYGIPCVSYNCPCGPKDIITDGEDGFLIPNGDIINFAEHLNILIESQELRLKLGDKARIKSKHYLPNVIVQEWDKLIKNLIKSL